MPSRIYSDDDEEEEEEVSQEPVANAPPQFQPGSLIRIKLENFVTYTSAEFKMGPSLNMIIGPNGTGKSTVVCAICIGLGFNTSVCTPYSTAHHIR